MYVVTAVHPDGSHRSVMTSTLEHARALAVDAVENCGCICAWISKAELYLTKNGVEEPVNVPPIL
jgi:hypothetical protein